jgi:alpha-N-arabinofuranosidase
VKIPEFILKKLYVPGSLKTTPGGFTFDIHNTFAPATVTGVGLDVDGVSVPLAGLSLQEEGRDPYPAVTISPTSPFFLSVNVRVHFIVQGVVPRQGHLTVHVLTREAGELALVIQASAPARSAPANPMHSIQASISKWLRRRQPPYPEEITVDAGAVIGEISPNIYGHFVEHLERCVYGGIWTENGANLRSDTLALVKALKPSIIRYPGGNFASGYHWEDGIGPRPSRPRCYDQAWHNWDNNMVGTDEFMQFCAQVGADPFLVVNDGSGTPDEAARWVAYCNDVYGEQAGLRAANGHPAAYYVRWWGLGNEVWGEWQIGHTDAESYVNRARPFITAMRAVDPTIHIVGVGDGLLSDDPVSASRQWNDCVLVHLGDQIDALSFHVYNPGQEGWRERYDAYELHHLVCAAPLSVEAMIRRMAAQTARLSPWRKVGVALDEWNLFLPPVQGAKSMHHQAYNLRDALYTAGKLNAFQRQCNSLVMANLAQLVNVLPLIVTDKQRAFATAIYYPFQLYRRMESLALRLQTNSPTFSTSAEGNVAAQQEVPYLDSIATCDPNRQRLVLGLVNRHPDRKCRLDIHLRGFESGQPGHRLTAHQGWLLSSPNPLDANTFENPNLVIPQTLEMPARLRDRLVVYLPPASLAVLVMKAEVE